MPCPDPGGAGRREGRGPRTGTGPPRRRRHGALGTWPAVGLTLAVLAAANVAAHLGPAAAAVRTAAALAVSALLLGVLRWAGGTRADAGLARCTMARGARWALALVGIVAAVYLVAALLPAGRALFEDRRYAGMDGGELALRIGARRHRPGGGDGLQGGPLRPGAAGPGDGVGDRRVEPPVRPVARAALPGPGVRETGAGRRARRLRGGRRTRRAVGRSPRRRACCSASCGGAAAACWPRWACTGR